MVLKRLRSGWVGGGGFCGGGDGGFFFFFAAMVLVWRGLWVTDPGFVCVMGFGSPI